MASSIPPLSAVAAGNAQANMNTKFSRNLDRLAAAVRQSAAQSILAESITGELVTVKATVAIEQVNSANNAVAEARQADRNLDQAGLLLRRARTLAFEAINSPERRLSGQALEEFHRAIGQIGQLTADKPLAEGGVAQVDPRSFKGSLSAIVVIDRALSELTDQRGLLGFFQASKLAEVGRMLRSGVAGAVTSSSVVRDRVVASALAQGASNRLEEQPGSSLLENRQGPGLILAAIAARAS
ncbi:MAG: hypothetical protein ACK5TN_21325 [Acidobacteriota bacterium]|jgi:hypothetical protein